ncbi:chitin-binding type-2 domain-containing protein [Trichonephila clavipes]|nr:chitin-binding type-2 domain-containing protein [Trichonephila clavipes]
MGVLKNVCVIFLVISLVLCFAFSQDYPTYWEMDLPQTRFTCKDKVNGGYYADIETECQMYHVCHRNKFGAMRSTRFLCGNGTVFDQRHLVCQDYRKVRRRCRDSEKYYNNVATLLEQLEAGLRSEEADKAIMKAAEFQFERLK